MPTRPHRRTLPPKPARPRPREHETEGSASCLRDERPSTATLDLSLVLHQRTPGREPALDRVPPRDPIALAEPPAEVDLFPPAVRPEVDEPTVHILHLDPELGHFAEQRLDLAGHRRARPRVIRRLPPLQVLEQRPHARQQRLGLGAGELRHILTLRRETEGPMATFVLLTKVTPAGVKTLQANPRRIKEVNKEIEATGARVVAQYATLGRYDFVNVVGAKEAGRMGRGSVGRGG